jgi:hypothetical protein
VPPTIQFISRVNLPFVSQTDGKVEKTKLPVLTSWNHNNSIETVLVEIRRSVLILRFFCSSPTSTISFFFVFSERWRRLAIASFRSLPKARLSKATGTTKLQRSCFSSKSILLCTISVIDFRPWITTTTHTACICAYRAFC